MLMEEFDVTNRTAIDVRYQETDQMGVVYHANYLVWFEIGRTKLIEQLGFTYPELEAEGVLLPVIDTRLTYHQPARYGETVYVETVIKQYKGVRLTYDYVIKNEKDATLVTGYTEHTFVEKGTFRPIRLRSINQKWHNLLKDASKEGEVGFWDYER